MDELARDLRFGLRSLRRTPVVAGAGVLSIALGIAATTAVFGVVDAALFRPPPLDRAEQLVAVYATRQAPNHPSERERWSWPRTQLLRQWTTSFESLATFTVSVLALTGDDPEPLNVEIVSHEYFPTLHVQPIVGRGFDASEDSADGALVAVLSYDLWQRRFGGDRTAVGRPLSINGVAVTIVGVMPPRFVGLSGRAQAWAPVSLPRRASYPDYLTTNQSFISVIARLKAGVTVERARSELARVGPEIQRASPALVDVPGTQFAATAVTLNEARIDPTTTRPMLLLLAAAGCLLLLACANVAGLLLGRAATRRREIGIRIATGATRGRVVRQLLAEAGILSVVGGAVGIAVAIPLTMNASLPQAMWRGRNFYGALSEFSSPRVDARVLVVSIAICAVTTIVFGLVPALQATRLDLTSVLRSGTGASVDGARATLRRAIVGIETGLAVVLLAGGALLAMSWHRLETTDPGFDRTHLLTFLVRPAEAAYPPPKAAELWTRILAAVERVPGVDAASVDGCTPVGTGCANSTLNVIGRPVARPDEAPPVLRHYVAPDHFRALHVPVLRGRVFDERDRAGSPRVAVINQTAARRFWPNEDPIGKRVWFNGGSNFDRPDSSAEIVGVVGDVAYQPLDERPFQADFYTPFTQFTYATRTVLVRTRLDPASLVPDLRRAVRSADHTLALFDIRTMDDVMSASWARLTYQTKILSGFATIALLLAATGIFAIVAHVIGARRREIGVRVALGATPARVLMIVGESGARPAMIGLVAGVVATLLVERALAATVYGVRSFDGRMISGVALVLATVIG
ncbi:MAG: ABC transporter permease, partial [Gemmatimonadaceae bacterium]